MPRKPNPPRRLDDEDPEPIRRYDPRPPVEPDPAETTYTDFLAKFKGSQGVRVKVYRQTQRGRQYCFFGPPEDFESEETLRLYHARQPFASEEGQYFLAIEVNGEQRNMFPINIAPQSQVASGLQAPQYGGMADPFQAMRENDERWAARFSLQQQEKTPVVEIVSAMAELDKMRQPKEMPLDTILKCIEIGKSLGAGPQDDWKMLLLEAVKDNGPLIAAALGKIVGGGPKPAQVGPPVTEGVSADMKAEEQEKVMLQSGIAYLKRKALQGSDPLLYVDLIVDNREDALYGRLVSEILSKEFSEFAAIEPDISNPQFIGFFRAVYDGVRQVFRSVNQMATDKPRKDGNPPDAPANGATGKTGKK